MQNFKSFLLENNGTNSLLSRIKIGLQKNENTLSALRANQEIIRSELSKVAFQQDLPPIDKITFFPSSCAIRHTLPPGKYERWNLEKFGKQYATIVGNHFNNPEPIFNPWSDNPLILIPDNYKMDVFVNVLDCQTNFQNTTTLQNIHKIINCNKMDISNIGMIRGNVLGLLNIKSLEHIVDTDIEESPLWFNIVEAHVEEGKDLLDCQEELISNGLKEYAKL